jgi:hypothetical protein
LVWIIYGSSDGLTPYGYQVWYQDSPGVAGIAEPDDGFGYALAAGDFNRDGRADLAIGVPMEDYAVEDDGVVHVLYGSADGLTADGDDLWYEGALGATAAVDDFFGTALASGDFNGDSADDLAVSAGAVRWGLSERRGRVRDLRLGRGARGHRQQAWLDFGGRRRASQHHWFRLAQATDGVAAPTLRSGPDEAPRRATKAASASSRIGHRLGSAEVWAQHSSGTADSRHR